MSIYNYNSNLTNTLYNTLNFTGSTSNNYMLLSSNQSVSGVKTFTDSVQLTDANDNLIVAGDTILNNLNINGLLISSVTSDLQNNKANNIDVVKLTGTQTILGDKTFSNNVIIGTTNVLTNLNLKAVDSTVVHNTGTETIDGNKTFSGNIRFNGSQLVGDTTTDLLTVNSNTTINGQVSMTGNIYLGTDGSDLCTVRCPMNIYGSLDYDIPTSTLGHNLSYGVLMGRNMRTNEGLSSLCVSTTSGSKAGFEIVNFANQIETNRPAYFDKEGKSWFINSDFTGDVTVGGNVINADLPKLSLENNFTNANNNFLQINSDNIVNTANINTFDLNVTNSITLPASSVADTALTDNVCLMDIVNRFPAGLVIGGTGEIPTISVGSLVLKNGISIDSGAISMNLPDNCLSANIPRLSAGSTVFTGGVTCTNLSATGVLSLPAGSIADGNLTSNIPRKDGSNTYSGIATFNNPIILPNRSITDIALSTNVVLKASDNTFTTTTTFNNIATTGTVTLPVNSVSDDALSENVLLADQTLTLIGNQDADVVKFTTYNQSQVEGLLIPLGGGSTYTIDDVSSYRINETGLIYSKNDGTEVSFNLHPTTESIFNNGLIVGTSITLPDNSIANSALQTSVITTDKLGTYALESERIILGGTFADYEANAFQNTGNSHVEIINGKLRIYSPRALGGSNQLNFDPDPLTGIAFMNIVNANQLNATSLAAGSITCGSQIKIDSSLSKIQGITTFDMTGTTITNLASNDSVDVNFTGNINTVSATELNYMSGVTSSLQTQIDTKSTIASPSFTGVPLVPTAISTTNTTQIASTAFVKGQIADLINGSASTLDTLNELATALGNDPAFATTMTNLIGTKATIDAPTFTGTVSGISQAMVGLANVDNTADTTKPVSTAQQTALDLKANLTLITNVDNTADTAKPVSTAQQTALDLKADLTAISNMNNTSDLAKPVSTAQQTALDLKANLTLISNMNNTSDLAKPVSTAQQTALDLKANLTLISNVDNVSDLAKPVSTAQQTAFNLKADLTLISNIDNTSDLAKPVSTAQQTALDLKADTSSLAYWDATSSVQTQINAKAELTAISNMNNTSDLAKPVSTAQQTALDFKANLTLITNVDNTSDLAKPVSTAQQTALDLKANLTAISNMDNTSDLAKPVSTAQQTALDLKAETSSLAYWDATSSVQTQINAKADTSSLAYLDATSSIQNQIDAINATDGTQQTAIDDRLSKSSGGIVTANFTARQTLNIQEIVTPITVSTGTCDCNFANGGLIYVSLPDANNFEATVINANPTSSTTTTSIITLIIDTSTYLAYANTLRVNGTLRTLLFSSGATAIDLTGATKAVQTISIIYSGSSSVPVACLSSVIPFMI